MTEEHKRVREIGFNALHPDADQAELALELIRDVKGILKLDKVNPLLIRVTYQLPQVTLALIEHLLDVEGLHLDTSLLFKLKRALAYFVEENELEAMQQANHALPPPNDAREIFLKQYARSRHGCRDERPRWRGYL